jgi:molybdopterin converting factor small subunit
MKIPPVLRPEAGGERVVTVGGATVREALLGLIAQHPALEQRIFDDGALPSFLNVFVDGDDIRLHDGLDTPVGDASTVVLLPAVAGGSGTCGKVDVAGIGLYPGTMMCAPLEKPYVDFSIFCAQPS